MKIKTNEGIKREIKYYEECIKGDPGFPRYQDNIREYIKTLKNKTRRK